MSNPGEWHVVIDGAPVGPLSFEELLAAVRAGRVKRESPVWRTDLRTRAAAGRIPGLSQAFEGSKLPADYGARNKLVTREEAATAFLKLKDMLGST